MNLNKYKGAAANVSFAADTHEKPHPKDENRVYKVK